MSICCWGATRSGPPLSGTSITSSPEELIVAVRNPPSSRSSAPRSSAVKRRTWTTSEYSPQTRPRGAPRGRYGSSNDRRRVIPKIGGEGLPNVAPMTYIVVRVGYTIPGARGKSRRREGRCPPHRCGCGAYPRTVRTSDERRAGTPRGEAGRGDVGGLGKTKGGIRERAHRSKHRVAPLFSALRCADMRRAWTSIIVGHGRDRDTGPSPTVLSEP